MHAPAGDSVAQRRRVPKACEHCRVVKARCQPSDQPGVCKKCFIAKRECVSRAKARPGRARDSAQLQGIAAPATHAGSPSTLELDFTVPQRLPQGDIDELRQFHSDVFDKVLDDTHERSHDDSGDLAPPHAETAQPVSEAFRKPQFNVESAAALLKVFHTRTRSLPFVSLSKETTVSELAATRPFLLLAILAVTSGAQSAQKHALYDDEFLKIIALKYISAGERSMELLQGVLVYCAWYPFHLKPKTSKLPQCLRIAADIIQDLGLDEDFLTSNPWTQGVSDDELEQIRAYLAYVCLVSTYVVVWKGNRSVSTELPRWANTATAVLDQHSQGEADQVLAGLVRLSQIFSDASRATNADKDHVVRDCQLSLLEIGQRFQQLRSAMTAPCLYSNASIQIQTLFIDVFLDVGSLLAFPVAKTSLQSKFNRFTPPISKLSSGCSKIRELLQFAGNLDDAAMLSLTICDWTCLVAMFTLAFRLSLPLPSCPEFDSTWARLEIGLEHFLKKVALQTADKSTTSIISANRAVLGVLKEKLASRTKSLASPGPHTPGMVSGCPVLYKGMLEPMITEWDSDLSSSITQFSGSHDDAFDEIWRSVASDLSDESALTWDILGDDFKSYNP